MILLLNLGTRRIPGLRVRPQDSVASTPRQEMLLRPRERINAIREQIETALSRQKDQDHHWEDQIDVGVVRFELCICPNLY